MLLANKDVARLAPIPHPSHGKGHLLFVCGHLSPSWLAEIGSKYRVDPEFFCRHLDFLDSSIYRSLSDSPSLVSTTNNIIHVYVTTVLTNALGLTRTSGSLLGHRELKKAEMSKYKRQLPKSAQCGDSLVRQYDVFGDHHSIIEQRVSICITENGDGWTGKLTRPSDAALFTDTNLACS